MRHSLRLPSHQASQPALGTSMPYRAILCITLGIIACHATPSARGDRQGQGDSHLAREQKAPPADSVVQFLLAAATTDFHDHRLPDPMRFRDVRVGRVLNGSGEEQFLLCGQFLSAQQAGAAEWAPFATIKTSGYEQYVGAQAASFCQGPGVRWDTAGDLSSALQSRLTALR